MIILSVILSLFLTSLSIADDPQFNVEVFDYGNTINDLCISGDFILCATDGGLIKWDRKTLDYTIQNLFNRTNPGFWIDQPPVTHVAASADGHTMVVTEYGSAIIFYDGELWRNHNQGIFARPQQCLFADRSGRFWGGTSASGLYSWNGTDSTLYSVDSELSTVQDILKSDDGVIWLGTGGGLIRVDGENMRYFFESDGLPDDRITSLFDDNGTIWVGTRNGVGCVVDNTVTAYKLEGGVSANIVNDILVDRSGVLWVATNGGVARYDGVSWDYFTSRDELMDDRVTSMALDSGNRVWFCTSEDDKGMTVYEDGEFVWYTRFDGSMPVHEINAVANDSEGRVWIGWDGGAAMYENDSWTTFGTVDGLASENVTNIWAGMNNTVWVKFADTNRKGVSRFSDGQWQSYETDDDVQWNRVDSLLELPDASLILSYRKKIFRVNSQGVEEIVLKDLLIANKILDIDQAADGALWIGTDMGLVRYGEGSFVTWANLSAEGQNRVDELETAPDGTVWCLVNGKTLMHFENESFSGLSDPNGDDSAAFSSIKVDHNGILWAVKGYDRINYNQSSVAVFDFPRKETGLYSYDGVSWTYHQFPDERRFRYITLKEVVVDEDGVVWCSTDGGLARYDGVSWSLHSTNGPINATVADIAVDNDNVKWFATAKGISSYDGSEWYHYPCRRDDVYIKELLGFRKVYLDQNTNTKWFVGAFSTGGLFSIADGELISHDIDCGLSTSTIDADDCLWFSDDAGVMSYDGKVRREYGENEGLWKCLTYNIFVDSKNVKWFFAPEGAVSYDGKDFVKHPSGDIELSRAYIDTIFEDSKGTLWIVSDGDLISFDGVEWKKYTGTLEMYAVVQATLYNDMVWANNMGRLKVLDGDTWNDPSGIDVNDCYPVNFMYADRHGCLWIMTQTGNWFVYDGEEWLDSFQGEHNLGFNSDWVEDMDGSFWVANYNGPVARIVTTLKNNSFIPDTPLRLHGNSPNPFNVGTMIEFDLESMGTVTVSIYNMLGQKVYETAPLLKPVGRNGILWNGRDNDGAKVSSGVYFYRVKASGKSADGRMMFVK